MSLEDIFKKYRIFAQKFWWIKKLSYLCNRKSDGAIAQLVEQRTENPCVPGSIPGGTTKKDSEKSESFLFYTHYLIICAFSIVGKRSNIPPIGGNFRSSGQKVG